MNLNQYLITGLCLACGSSLTSQAETAKAEPTNKPNIEVCFVLDTTGSMGGLIQGAKEKIWSIANEIASAKPTPDLKVGLIAYRDRRDDYITKQFALTDDIDAIYADLLKFEAGGGGDGPESVNQALHEAVRDMKWSTSKDVLKIIFLVGDAPPHMDYQDDTKYPEICQAAMKKDLVINTIQCGSNSETTSIWKEIASKSEGDFAAILQDGGTIAISTPLDGEIAALNGRLNATVVAYGNTRTRATVEMKLHNNTSAPAEAVAARADYLIKQKVASLAVAKQVSGNDDLIALIAEKKIKPEEVELGKLPETVAKMPPAERTAWINSQLNARELAQGELTELLKKRDAFVKDEKARLAKEGKGDGFDEKVGQTLRKQAAKKGFSYETK